MTRVLVDTHALLWWLDDSPLLSTTARSIIADPATEPLVSAASVWEIAIKGSLGKITAPDDLLEQIAGNGFGWLAVEPRHAWLVRAMPAHHRDPFDRILIAQAMADGLEIVTKDERFRDYDVAVCW